VPTIVGLMRLISGGLTRPSVGEFPKPPRDVFRYALEGSEKRWIFAGRRKRLRLWDEVG
jgi:hypothetical protein